MHQDETRAPDGDISPDGEDRIRDFLTRHGGVGPDRQDGKDSSGTQGWYEIYAADGYKLRCDWTRTGGREEMRYLEVAPRS